MHLAILAAAAPHATRPSAMAAAVFAILAALVVVLVFKGIAKLLSPKKKKSRSGSSYAYSGSKK